MLPAQTRGLLKRHDPEVMARKSDGAEPALPMKLLCAARLPYSAQLPDCLL